MPAIILPTKEGQMTETQIATRVRKAGKLYADKMSVETVADRLGVSYPTAKSYIIQSGERIRNPKTRMLTKKNLA